MGWFVQYAVLRLRARWRALATLIIGVLLAALIGANASLYTNAIAQVGMVRFLATQDADDVNLNSRTSLSPGAVEDFASSWAELDRIFIAEFENYLSDFRSWTANAIDFAETQPLFLIFNGEDIPNAQVRLAYYQNIENYTELVEGEWPGIVSDDSVQLEVALAANAAAQLGLTVGDVIQLDQRGWDTSRIFSARVSGLVRPRNPDAPYWFEPSPLRIETSPLGEIETNLLVSRVAMETIPPQYIPQPSIQIGWRIPFDHGQLAYTRIDDAILALDNFEGELNRAFLADETTQGNFVYLTNLPTLLTDYREQIVFLNIPFGLLILNLAALVLFFLVLIAALVRRGERREIALLQSRGATNAQIIWARSVEALIICVTATLLSPFIAQQLLKWFIPIFTGIEQLPLELNLQVFAFAGVASGCAFLLLVLTLFPVLRLPLISAGGLAARSGRQSWWQRYYLDVVLLIVGIAALYQLTRSQTLVAQSATGRIQADPLLLLAPTLLFVAFSGVLLRFFPILMNVVAEYFSRHQGLEAALASWQVSREPLHYGRIAFLLALAIGIGWFAISYQATLVGNQQDQAIYFVGSDVRITYRDSTTSDTQISMDRIANLPQVAASSRVARIQMPSMATGGRRRSRQPGTILAVDSETLNRIVPWRNDLGELANPSPFSTLPEVIGRPIPVGTERISFWARIDATENIAFGVHTQDFRPFPLPLLADFAIQLRLQDESGVAYYVSAHPNSEPYDAFLERLLADSQLQSSIVPSIDTDGDGIMDDLPPIDWPDDGWVYYEINLSELDPLPQGHLNFSGLDIAIVGNYISDVQLTINDLQFIDTDGNITLSDWFGEPWDIVPTSNSVAPTSYTRTQAAPGYGETALVTNFSLANSFDNPGAFFSLLLNYPQLASITIVNNLPGETQESDQEVVGMPVFASTSFLELNEFEIGQRFSLSVTNLTPWFEVLGVSQYYPTLYQEQPYLIIDQAILNYTLQRVGHAGISPNELWLDLRESTDQAAFVANLQAADDAPLFKDIFGVEDTLRSYRTDIFALGVIGLLLISFGVGLALSVVSLFTYIGLTVQSRIGEFAVLRAMGMTTIRMVLSIVIEQLLVLIAAIVLGIVIGQFLTSQVLPPLALSAVGGSVTPPFVILLNYVAVLQYLLVISLVLFIVLLFSVFWVRSAATAEALRLSEE